MASSSTPSFGLRLLPFPSLPNTVPSSFPGTSASPPPWHRPPSLPSAPVSFPSLLDTAPHPSPFPRPRSPPYSSVPVPPFGTVSSLFGTVPERRALGPMSRKETEAEGGVGVVPERGRRGRAPVPGKGEGVVPRREGKEMGAGGKGWRTMPRRGRRERGASVPRKGGGGGETGVLRVI